MCFATGTPTGSGPDADDTNQTKITAEMVGPQMLEQQRVLNEATVTDQRKRTKNKLQNAIEVDEEKDSPEILARDIQQQARTLEGKMQNLKRALDEDGIKLFVQQTGQEAERNKILSTIDSELAAVHEIYAINGDIEKWTQGSLQAETFIKDIEFMYKNAKSEKADTIIQDLKEYHEQHREEFKQSNRRSDPNITLAEIERWESTNSEITPEQFVGIIRNYYNIKTADDHKMLQQLEEYLKDPAHAETIRLWETKGGDKSNKITMIRELSDIARVGAIKQEIEAHRKLRADMDEIARTKDILLMLKQNTGNLASDMQNVENLFREKSDLFAKDQDLTATHGSYDALGFKFYSALEMWSAFKEVYDAFHTAWHDHSHHKTAELAKNIGASLEWVPMYGTPAGIALKKNQESHNEKEKNEYMEYLKQNSFNYDQLFNHHDGQLHLNHHNPNRIRAILEFAAGKGWLYDLDLSAGENVKKVMGQNLAGMLTDMDENELLNYYNSLRGTNASGRENEIKAAHDKVKDIENIPFFISEIEIEMKRSNLWAAVGIASRAIERGLWGETVPWVMTTIMRVLRENKEIRKKASVDFYDKLGALSLYHSDSSMGGLKIARKDFYKWSQYGGDENLSTVTTSMRVLKDIEEEIRTKTGQSFDEEGKGDNSKYKLDSYVAKMFASQPVVINGKKFSIFSHKYDYFTHSKLGQGNVSIDKEDEDYYANQTGNLRADAIVVKAIFSLGSTGQLENEAWATKYATTILGLNEELISNGMLEEARNFRKIMGGKLKIWLESAVLRNANAIVMLKFLTDKGFFLEELFKQKFIHRDVLVNAVKEQVTNHKLASELLRTLDKKRSKENTDDESGNGTGATATVAPAETQQQREARETREGKTMWPGGIENLPKTTQAP